MRRQPGFPSQLHPARPAQSGAAALAQAGHLPRRPGAARLPGLRASQGELGANPIAEIENELGLTALIFLVVSLVPARRRGACSGWTWPPRIRRELGLFAFFYASLHFLTYLVLDQFFDWGAILADIAQRPFITVGFIALVLMTPLALTSTNGWVRRLGFQRWTAPPPAQSTWPVYWQCCTSSGGSRST